MDKVVTVGKAVAPRKVVQRSSKVADRYVMTQNRITHDAGQMAKIQPIFREHFRGFLRGRHG